MKISKVEVEVPAGKYILGDPCYAVPDSEWMELLESCDYFNTPIGTIRRNGYSETTGAFKPFKVVAFNTRWGDGCYEGTDGCMYPVDAGLIGLVPIELVGTEELRSDLCTVVTFTTPVKCSSNGDGKLRFGSITIDTDPEDDEDEAQEIDDASWRA